MKENVSGYSRNPCSLNRERDTAFAAKLLRLPTAFFSAEKSEEWMARSPVWPDDVIASETASRHQPMNWRDSIWVQDSVTRRRSRSGQRSVSFPIQRTRVTRVTRDVFTFCNSYAWVPQLYLLKIDFKIIQSNICWKTTECAGHGGFFWRTAGSWTAQDKQEKTITKY